MSRNYRSKFRDFTYLTQFMKLDIIARDFRCDTNHKVDLPRWPARIDPLYTSKRHYHALLDESREEIGMLQEILYAHDRYAILLIFQGMDSAGKGGAIKHVMSGINPQGCQVFSFQQPSSEELEHDFLWRTNKRLPERGRIGIFDRSYYEEVVTARVWPDVLARQRLPAEFVDTRRIWKERFNDIVNLEDYLHRNGTRVIKFFLHLSREEQRKRLLARIDEPHKNWKIGYADIEARKRWDDYQAAYAECIAATGSLNAPWYIVPADDRRNTRLIVSWILLETMKSLRMGYPISTAERREELVHIMDFLQKDT